MLTVTPKPFLQHSTDNHKILAAGGVLKANSGILDIHPSTLRLGLLVHLFKKECCNCVVILQTGSTLLTPRGRLFLRCAKSHISKYGQSEGESSRHVRLWTSPPCPSISLTSTSELHTSAPQICAFGKEREGDLPQKPSGRGWKSKSKSSYNL